LKLVLLPRAKRDLDAIFDPALSRVVKRLRLLEQFPELGPRMIGRFRGYRSTTIGLFRIVYCVFPSGTIEIAYIRNCRRAPLD
jgi:plasmid stabilization system protein ParE